MGTTFIFRPHFFLGFLLILFQACSQPAEQQVADPRYEVIPALDSASQVYYFQEFTGDIPGQTDSIKMATSNLGQGRYLVYEIYNEYLNAQEQRELDVLETIIDTGDTVMMQKVRDQRFVWNSGELKLTRFDTKSVRLDEVYEVAVGDTIYLVYNLYGYAHPEDFTPSHRIFWTEDFGIFFFWYGKWHTLELVGTKEPYREEALLALRSEIRDQLAIPFDPIAPE